MLLDTFGATLLGNLLTGKVTFRAGEGMVTSRSRFLMSHYLLTNFERQKYY